MFFRVAGSEVINWLIKEKTKLAVTTFVHGSKAFFVYVSAYSRLDSPFSILNEIRLDSPWPPSGFFAIASLAAFVSVLAAASGASHCVVSVASW